MSKQLRFAFVGLLVAAGGSASWAASNSTASALVAKFYPVESLQKGEQGVVQFEVTLDSDAKIESCVVTKSSGYRLLDKATCDLIVTSAHFPPAQSDGVRVATVRSGLVNWKLPEQYRQNAGRAPATVSVSAAELEADRLICKRTQAIGSVIKKNLHCLTQANWDLSVSGSQEAARKIINPYASSHGCHYVGPRC